MIKYPGLNNTENILIEITNGGPVDSETVSSLLGVSLSTASNSLRKAHGMQLLKRRNTRGHKKEGGPKYEYSLTAQGRRKLLWIKKKISG